MQWMQNLVSPPGTGVFFWGGTAWQLHMVQCLVDVKGNMSHLVLGLLKLILISMTHSRTPPGLGSTDILYIYTHKYINIIFYYIILYYVILSYDYYYYIIIITIIHISQWYCQILTAFIPPFGNTWWLHCAAARKRFERLLSKWKPSNPSGQLGTGAVVVR